MKKNSKNKRIIIITLSLLIFLFILKDVFQYEVISYDNWAYTVFVENIRSNNMTIFMKLITTFGSVYILCSIIFLLVLLVKDKKISFLVIINTLLSLFLNSLIKFIIQRPRPSGYNLINETFYSFPSGHSMVSTAFYGFLIYLAYKKIDNKYLKYSIISLLVLLIILICISRIYLGVHYLSDVIAGFAFSIAYLMIFITIIEKLTKEENYANKKRKKEKV